MPGSQYNLKILVELLKKGRGAKDAQREVTALGKEIEKTSDATSRMTKKSGRMDKALGFAKKNWMAMAGGAAAAGAAVMAAKKVFDMGAEGAQIKQLGESFDLMNESVFKTPTLLRDMQEATRNTVSETQLMSGILTLTAGASENLASKLAESAPRMAEIAKAANKLNPTLGTTGFMFESISTGIKRSSPLILDNLGIMVKVGEANEKYAEQLGKTVDQLTAEEKQIALLNEVMESGGRLIEQVGGDVSAAGDKFEQTAAETANFTDELKVLVSKITGPVVSALAKGMKRNREYAESFRELKKASEGVAISLLLTSDETVRLRNRLQRITIETMGTAKSAEALAFQQRVLATASENAADLIGMEITELTDLAIKLYLADQAARVLEDTYDQWGLGTEEVTGLTKGLTDATEDASIELQHLTNMMYFQNIRAERMNEVFGELYGTIPGVTDATEDLDGWLEQLRKSWGVNEFQLEQWRKKLEHSAEAEEKATAATKALAAAFQALVGRAARGGISLLNEEFSQLGPQMVVFGGRTADQNRILGEATAKYDSLGRAIVDVDIGLAGLGMSTDEQTEAIGGLVEQQDLLNPLIDELSNIHGSANMVIREATVNQDALNEALYEGVTATTSDAGAITGLGLALGVLNEQQATAILKQIDLELGIQAIREAYVNEMISADEAKEAIIVLGDEGFAAMDKVLQAALDLHTAIDNLPTEKRIRIIWDMATPGPTRRETEEGQPEPGTGGETMQHGGIVHGSPGIDRVPAMLTAGEGVLPKSAMQMLGNQGFEQIRRGNVAAGPGGGKTVIVENINFYVSGMAANPRAMADQFWNSVSDRMRG